MLSAAKILLGTGLIFLSQLASARNIYVLAIGDQSAANCHQYAHSGVPGVFVLDEAGQERPATDPLDWSDCRGGSLWIPLAARLRGQAGVDKVILMPVAVTNARAADWTAGPAASRLKAAIAVAKARNIRFDYALWQQSSSGHVVSSELNFAQLLPVVKKITLEVGIEKWLIANNGAHQEQQGTHPRTAMVKFKDDVVLRRFSGPTDAGLTEQDLLPGNLLTAAGQDIMAQRWFEAIQRADRLAKFFEKESLLYFFK